MKPKKQPNGAMKMRGDLRSPLAKARDNYMAGANCDSSTLGNPSANNQYLRNRIEAAFLAGYNLALTGEPSP